MEERANVFMQRILRLGLGEARFDFGDLRGAELDLRRVLFDDAHQQRGGLILPVSGKRTHLCDGLIERLCHAGSLPQIVRPVLGDAGVAPRCLTAIAGPNG